MAPDWSFLGEPDLIPPEDRQVEETRIVGREYKLGPVGISLRIVEETNQARVMYA